MERNNINPQHQDSSRPTKTQEQPKHSRSRDQGADKKKKKHRQQRQEREQNSRSRSREGKKKRSRSRGSDRERKHKKHHKDHRDHKSHKDDHRDRRYSREPRELRDTDQYQGETARNRQNQEKDRRSRDRKERETQDRQAKEKSDRDKNQRERAEKDRNDRERAPERRILDEKDPYFEQRRQIERVRRTSPDRAEHLENDLEKRIIFEKKKEELEQAKEKFKQAQKEMEEAKREDHTILVYCLPLKAKEKDIWNFFYKANIGRIRDIRIIKDGRSGKSKGVAYVQFYTSQSVEKALMMSDRPFELKGRSFMGLRVQHSQAEKNRAAAAAKRMRVVKAVDPNEQAHEIHRRQTKVFVGGLTDKLADINESELKELFDPFGEIDYVDIHRDGQTGKCKGFAFIQYTNTQCAKAAVKEMHGLSVGGQKITVQTVSVTEKHNGQGHNHAGDDLLHSQGTKTSLMNKLSHTAPTHSNLSRPPISTVSTPYILMGNLFKMEGTTPAFFEELKKEVLRQAEQFGIVEKIFMEKNNQGNVWLKFSDTASAIKAQEKLNGKFFDGVKIFCYFVTETTHQTRVGN